LVIAAVPFQEKALAEILKAGARFLGLAPRTLTDIYTDIATIAGTVGVSSRGEEVVRSMQRQIEDVRTRTATAKRPRVFCEEWGKPIIASQPWVAELIYGAGGDFVGTPARQYSSDEITALNPDVIIAAWCGAGDRVPLEKIVADRGWERTSAALSGRVFCIRDEFLNTPAPTLLQGLDALAWAIHPDAFPHTKGIRQITGVPGPYAENPTC
jgi:iron complex transport system substrate-binding protein